MVKITKIRYPGTAYDEHRFSKKPEAIKFQKSMKKDYGYRPALFEVINGKNKHFVIVKPKGLDKI